MVSHLFMTTHRIHQYQARLAQAAGAEARWFCCLLCLYVETLFQLLSGGGEQPRRMTSSLSHSPDPTAPQNLHHLLTGGGTDMTHRKLLHRQHGPTSNQDPRVHRHISLQ